MTTWVVPKASAIKRGADVGRRTSATRGHNVTTPANSSSGVGRVHLISKVSDREAV